jgi:hypothetical protein
MSAQHYVIPEHRRDAFDWRSDAAELDLRNRVIPADDWALLRPTSAIEQTAYDTYAKAREAQAKRKARGLL